MTFDPLTRLHESVLQGQGRLLRSDLLSSRQIFYFLLSWLYLEEDFKINSSQIGTL